MLVNVLALNRTDHHRNCTSHKQQLGATIKKLAVYLIRCQNGQKYVQPFVTAFFKVCYRNTKITHCTIKGLLTVMRSH